MADRKQQALEALQNPNVRAFLDMLSAAEGTETHGYATNFGGTALESLADHPRQRHGFRETTGKRNVTTAAGRYQFLESTWDDVAKKLGLPDFGAQSQDIAAVELLRRAGALGPILEGDFSTAVKRSGATWASLPSSPYAQKKRSEEFIASRLPANPERMVEMPAWLQQALAAQTGAAPGAAGGPVPPAALPAGVPPIGAPTGPAGVPAGAPIAAPTAAVPATAPNAVQQLLAATTPPRPMLDPLVEPEPEFTPEDDALLAQSVDMDVATAREQALANFFGEQYVPEMELPPQIEDSINRYLALL